MLLSLLGLLATTLVPTSSKPYAIVLLLLSVIAAKLGLATQAGGYSSPAVYGYGYGYSPQAATPSPVATPLFGESHFFAQPCSQLLS